MSAYAKSRTDPVPDGMKRCTHCEIDYANAAEHFHVNSKRHDGLDSWCKTCVGLRCKRYDQMAAAKTRADDALALEVGRAAWDETGWRLDRLGIDWTDDLIATVPPLVDAHNQAPNDDDGVRAIGRVLIEAGAKLPRSAPAVTTTTPATEEDEPEEGEGLDLDLETGHVGPTIPPEQVVPVALGVAYLDGRLGVTLCDSFGESVSAHVTASVQARMEARTAFRTAADSGDKQHAAWADVRAAYNRGRAAHTEIGRAIIAEIGEEPAQREHERLHTEIMAA